MKPLKLFLPRKILIINLFGIGDVLFTTPLIRRLKRRFPEVFIGYAANKRAAGVLENNFRIDRVFIYERDEYQAVYKKSKWQFVKQMCGLINRIREEHFDLAIDLSLNGSVSFLLWAVGIKNRIGFNYKNRSPWLTRKIRLEGYENKHVVEYYLGLLEEITGLPKSNASLPGSEAESLELVILEKDRQWAYEVLREKGIAGQKFIIGLVPGGGASWGKEAVYKRWAPEKYAQLADKIIEKFKADIILLGDQNEEELCARVSRGMEGSCLNLCGATTLTQLAALCAKCAVVVVNDGGPLHIAVAAGTKTVSIFGPVDERVYGPYPAESHLIVKKDIACRPCYRQFRMAHCEHISCLQRIKVEEVLEKVGEILMGGKESKG